MKKIKLKRDGLRINRILEEVTVTNLITNGSFETDDDWIPGNSGFSYDTTQHYMGERSVKLAGKSGVTYLFRSATGSIVPIIGHKYYGRHFIKTAGHVTAADARFEIFGGDGEGKNWVFAHNAGNFPDWTMQSNVVTVNSITSSNYYVRSFVVSASADVWTDALMIVDLTAAFGQGAEPSKEWCDKHLPFIEGTQTIKLNTAIGEYKVSSPEFVEDASLPVAMRIKGDKLLVKQIYEGENADLNLVINNFTIPRLTVNKAMTAIQMSCNQSGVKWFVTLGELPPGLTFTTSGKLSGTPTRPGTFYVLFACQKDEKIVTKGVSIVCGDKICRVIFNAGGGTCSEAYREVVKYTLLGTLPTPKLSGQVFAGWYTAATGGLPVDGQYTVIDDITLYARYGQSSNVQFGDPTTEFKIQYMGDRTNYADRAYTLYARRKGATTDTTELTFQTGIQSSDGTNSNNLTNTNRRVTLYLKVTNGGEAGYFDIGYLCDSYINGSDACHLQRITGGVQVGKVIKATVSYANSVWVGTHGQQTANKYVNQAVGTEWGAGTANAVDTGYTFTINDVFINNNSYTILEVTFQVI